MLNKVLIIGRPTRDPEGRYLPSGTPVSNFTLAINRNYKVNDQWKEETYFIDIITMGNLAERILKNIKKGDKILVEGELRQDRWETSEGEKRSRIKIFAHRISKLASPAAAVNKGEIEEVPAEEISNETFSAEDDDEDIPFQ